MRRKQVRHGFYERRRRSRRAAPIHEDSSMFATEVAAQKRRRSSAPFVNAVGVRNREDRKPAIGREFRHDRHAGGLYRVLGPEDKGHLGRRSETLTTA